MKRALIVMAREPRAGETKTRLTPPLTAKQAAALYHAFLLDTLDLMRQAPGVQPVIAYTPPEAERFFRGSAPPGFQLTPQAGAGLGERLERVLRLHLESQYDQAVVIGSDSPTLPPDYVTRAFEALDDPRIDVVLGPSEDGGYYLVGLKAPCAALFRGVAMSTPTVLTETLARAGGRGLCVALLPKWYDVDTPDDLARLRQELARGPTLVARHTRCWASGNL